MGGHATFYSRHILTSPVPSLPRVAIGNQLLNALRITFGGDQHLAHQGTRTAGTSTALMVLPCLGKHCLATATVLEALSTALMRFELGHRLTFPPDRRVRPRGPTHLVHVRHRRVWRLADAHSTRARQRIRHHAW